MPLRRRQLLRLAGAAALAAPTRRFAYADDYPTRSVRIIEGLGGGSTPNLVARLIGQWLSEHLNQPFVVESRTGAGGNIATQAVVGAAPDGYTLLTIVTTNAINATLYEKLDFDFIRDITPIAGVVRLPMVLMVNPAFPAATLGEFIAYAKANPGKVNIASPGIGTPMHVGIELLKLMAGVDLVHIAYRGPAAVWPDLFSGQVQAFIITVSTAIGFIRAGKVRPLAAAAIIDELSTNIVVGLADPQLKARITDLGGDTEPMPSAQFKNFIADETKKWAKVVKFSGAKVN